MCFFGQLLELSRVTRHQSCFPTFFCIFHFFHSSKSKSRKKGYIKTPDSWSKMMSPVNTHDDSDASGESSPLAYASSEGSNMIHTHNSTRRRGGNSSGNHFFNESEVRSMNLNLLSFNSSSIIQFSFY